MKADLIKSYTSLRDALHKEKAKLESRLKQIDAVLGQPTPAVVSAVKPQPKQRRQRIKGAISMKAAVVQATKDRPLSKPDILEAIHKLGFRTTSKTPLHALNNLLYGKNPRFKQQNGKFSPAGADGKAAKARRSSAPARSPRKRKLSAEGRAKIVAALKARWAKIKKAGGKSLKAAA